MELFDVTVVVAKVKCLYNHREESVEQAAMNDTQFCHDTTPRSFSCLLQVYYQIQMQLFVCNVQYCDFCLWLL